MGLVWQYVVKILLDFLSGFFLFFFFLYFFFHFVNFSSLTFNLYLIWWTFLDFINVFGYFNINWLFVILFLTVLFIFIFMLPFHPPIITWGKPTFFYFEVEAPKGINLIMFRNSGLTFSAKKNQKKIRVRFWVTNLFMLHSTGYSALNEPISHRDAHKTCIF